MELLAHDTASRQNAMDHSSAPLEVTTEFGGDNVKENPDDMNISLTARERLLKKLQGIRTTVSVLNKVYVGHCNPNFVILNLMPSNIYVYIHRSNQYFTRFMFTKFM